MTTFDTPRRAARAGVGSISWATLHCVALIGLAVLLILVILPAVLDAAGIQAVVTV